LRLTLRARCPSGPALRELDFEELIEIAVVVLTHILLEAIENIHVSFVSAED
jgi:hypothetical protein